MTSAQCCSSAQVDESVMSEDEEEEDDRTSPHYEGAPAGVQIGQEESEEEEVQFSMPIDETSNYSRGCLRA